MPHPRMLDPAKAALVVIDLQEAFRDAIPDFSALASRAANAARGFQILGCPVIVTEHYPKGLGRSAEEILQALSEDHRIFDKTAFSSCGAGAFIEKIDEHKAKQIVLCGIEAHVCVNQSAHDLLDRGFDVHILMDCVASRSEDDKRAGLAKMQSSGVTPSSLEMALFELMRDSKHEKFKEIQKLVR